MQVGVVEMFINVWDIIFFVFNNVVFDVIGNLVSELIVEQLMGILGYYVIVGQIVYFSQIEDGVMVIIFQGGDIMFWVEDGSVFVNSVRVVKVDVFCVNGVIYVIDG